MLFFVNFYIILIFDCKITPKTPISQYPNFVITRLPIEYFHFRNTHFLSEILTAAAEILNCR